MFQFEIIVLVRSKITCTWQTLFNFSWVPVAWKSSKLVKIPKKKLRGTVFYCICEDM